MKLKSLDLKYFLKHEDRSFNFEENLNVVRAANEAGKCVSGDTWIHSDKGLVRIDSLIADVDDGFTPAEETVHSGQGAEAVSHFFKETDVETYRLQTEHGYEVTGTATHPMLTYDPKTAAFVFKKLVEIGEQDYLCVDRMTHHFPTTELDLPSFEPTTYNGIAKEFVPPVKMNGALAAVCGYLLANGSGSGPMLSLSSENKAVCQDFRNCLATLGVPGVGTLKSKGKIRGVQISSANFKRFIEVLFDTEKFDTARNKKVPQCILQASRENTRLFLRSLFDCDGYLAKGFEWLTASSSVASAVRVMLLNFGIVSTSSIKRTKNYDHDYHRFQVYGEDLRLLLTEVLFDSKKYSSEGRDFYPSKDDVVPGLNSYIRVFLHKELSLKPNGWLTLSSGMCCLNPAFQGTTGQPQANTQVKRLEPLLANLTKLLDDPKISELCTKVSDILNRGYFFTKFKSLTYEKIQTVYDITVPGSHTFVANGLVSHNSSMIEGLGYNLFGSAALAGTLEETLNWNAPNKNALKTASQFEHRGVDYGCTRGAAGAELVRQSDGKVLCTGHKEVTAYIEKMLGIPAGRSQHLIFANQNAIRGVLALGPTAASEFIEKLADFTEVDKLIKRLAAELTTGPTTALEDQLGQAQAQVAACEIPQVVDHTAGIQHLEAEAQTLTTRAAEMLRTYEQARSAYTANLDTNARLTATAEKLRGQVKTLEVTKASAEVAQRGKDEALSKLQEIRDLRLAAVARGLYDEFLALNKEALEGPEWEGDEESLKSAIEEMTALNEQQKLEIITSNAEKQLKLRSKVSSGACPTCGAVIGDPLAEAEHNAKIDDEVLALQSRIALLTSETQERSADLSQMNLALTTHQKIQAWHTNQAMGKILWTTGTIPLHAEWAGPVPPTVDTNGLALRSSDYEAVVKAAEKASFQIESCTEQLSALHIELQGIADEIIRVQAATVPPDQALKTEAETLSAAVQTAQNTVQNLRLEMIRSQDAAVAAQKQRDQLMAQVERLTLMIEQQRKDTVFLKAMKDARVLIAEKLWGIVMGGVSNYFSRLRGVSSVVVRTSNGFAVDGKNSRPSGSTLDILGLALRIVVSKVFADCGLLVIDEPSAGCDEERTSNMAAVVAGAGFEQVIWVSHQDIVEASACNLVQL